MNKALQLFDLPNSCSLTDNFIGFDDLFKEINYTLSRGIETSFPPYDIYTEEVEVKESNTKEEHTFIKFALAGIPKDTLRVKFLDNILTVYNEKDEMSEKLPNNRKNVRLGIAQRSFKVTKHIDKSLEMVGAKYTDGCLIIEFKKKPEPENIDQLGMINID